MNYKKNNPEELYFTLKYISLKHTKNVKRHSQYQLNQMCFQVQN